MVLHWSSAGAEVVQNDYPAWIATLVRGHRYDLRGCIFEAGIPRPCTDLERKHLERYAVIAPDTLDGDPVCMFDFAEDTTPRRSREVFPMAQVKARNARLGNYTTPATVEAARVYPLDKRKDHA